MYDLDKETIDLLLFLAAPVLAVGGVVLFTWFITR